MSAKVQHPYLRFEGTASWKALDIALDKLVGNEDLCLQTDRVYVLGFLCDALANMNNGEKMAVSA